MTTRPHRPGGRRDALDELLQMLRRVNREAYGLTATGYRSSPMYKRMLREQESLREAVHMHGWMRLGESGTPAPLRWSRSHGDS